MDFALMQRVFPFFMEAALVTIEISALALLLGLAMAALAAAARLSRSGPLRWLGTAYVSVFRGTPCLIQLFLLYFGGPQVGINLDPFAAGVIGLGLNIGAYMTESVRGAILAVDRGQAEASRTIGFSRWQTLRHVVVPQAVRNTTPPIGNNMIALLKESSLVSVIGIAELVHASQLAISETYRPFEFYIAAAALYYCANLVLEAGLSQIEKRVEASR